MQFVGVGALRTEAAAGNRRLGIAFDGNQLAILVKDELAATHAAVRTNRSSYFGSVSFRTQVARSLRHRLRTGTVGTSTKLLEQWPFREKFLYQC